MIDKQMQSQIDEENTYKYYYYTYTIFKKTIFLSRFFPSCSGWGVQRVMENEEVENSLYFSIVDAVINVFEDKYDKLNYRNSVRIDFFNEISKSEYLKLVGIIILG